MIVLVILKASYPPIQSASASCTGSCHHQCSALSFESQNTCQALLTAVDSLLECFERSEFRPRCCSASMCQEHPCCKGRDHQCRACSRHRNRTGRRNCPLDNSC